ncbi:D-lactate dehydrogenase (cytochrome) [Tranquillimonas rosea]|uniref:D-lactate dehydrogenase (cytochrome) n=1 Tax=Tranquillimonas rosea TaxID=641238 RepID=A0A1H9V1C9_9RHOB|nr:FAD-linked oxidase C-terminal domain-containing protein [Tranquillimonas rosea]SES15087.1 D-lactate dehydrogenase (cytochrome) [Tranquillimonas rosea]
MTIHTALDELSEVLGDRLSRSESDLALHGRSEAHFPETLPDGVLYPDSTEQVATAVRICATHGCPITGWGVGTSLEGHALATKGGVVMDFSRMDKVVEINAEDMDVRVQPGVTRSRLNEELRATGLFFSVDPGADATIGGMAATRASGTTAVRYGTMRDNVRALEVVMADGRVIRTGSRARKSSAGYDLTGLFVGSEGTLGLITELTLRLWGQPEAVSAGVCAFPDIGSAVDCVIETIQLGIPLARIEFIDAECVRAFKMSSGTDMEEKPHLMVEFHGSETAVAEEAARFGEVVAEHRGGPFHWSAKPEERTKLWKMRHEAAYSMRALKPGAVMMATDICVPISRLAEAVEETTADIAASPIPGPILGHVGDGNFHATLLIEPGNAAEMKAAKDLAARMADRALRMGGTVTGEHGIGLGKLDYMEAEHGDGWSVMGDIKRALDPGGLLNPGKLIRSN